VGANGQPRFANLDLVQSATGFNHAEGEAPAIERTKELRPQSSITPHGLYEGALADDIGAKAADSQRRGAAVAMLGLAARAGDGCGISAPRGGLKTEGLKGDAIRPFIEDMPSGVSLSRDSEHSTPSFPGHTSRRACEDAGVLGGETAVNASGPCHKARNGRSEAEK